MSEKVMVTLVICATAILLGVSACLTFIALTHDGTNESLIVTALIGVPTFIISIGGTIIGHFLGARSASQIVSAQNPSPPTAAG